MKHVRSNRTSAQLKSQAKASARRRIAVILELGRRSSDIIRTRTAADSNSNNQETAL